MYIEFYVILKIFVVTNLFLFQRVISQYWLHTNACAMSRTGIIARPTVMYCRSGVTFALSKATADFKYTDVETAC